MKNTIIGYFLFFFIVCFSSTITIFVYKHVENDSMWFISFILFIFISLTAFSMTIFDITRRCITVEKPMKEISMATKKMAQGDFNIDLVVNKRYSNYSSYDYIKDDLNVLALELSKNEVLKNDFISYVSHEIKTPLSIINSYAKELENDNLSKEERLKYLKHIENATLKLNDLVMNILKLNKLENQTLNIENKRFNLSESIINQIIVFEPLIDKKNISLSCDIDEDIYISSSEETLEIIWNNLISNAIKFTNEFGSIEIKLFKKDSRIIFEIADSGCGIDKDEGKYIFEKFFQCETSHSNEGNGLGLPLVKRVIDLIGGEIEVTSQINIGTTFIVKLKEN